MNAFTKFRLEETAPRLATVKVLSNLTIKVSWAAGHRVSRTDIVDLSPIVNSLRVYKILSNDKRFFGTAHLIEDGRVLAWGDDDCVDMLADSIEELADETLTPSDLRDFLWLNDFTHAEAAALLDRSRRQIENYLSGKEPIPRLFALACFGLAARQQQLLSGPLVKSYAGLRTLDTSTRAAPSLAEPSVATRTQDNMQIAVLTSG